MNAAHTHDHTPPQFGRALAWGIGLNLAFVLIEAFYGWRAGSLALLADAGHNLSDVLGLVMAWIAVAAARLLPDDRHTWGWQRGSIIASFANAVILLVTMSWLAWEAAHRFQSASPVAATTVMSVAAIGIVVNSVTAWLFMRGARRDLNIRGAFLHMAADALVSLGVVLSGGLYLWQGWAWIDPLVSLLIAAVIAVATWPLFRQSLHLLFDGIPPHIKLAEVRAALQGLPNVLAVHDLHVWALSTTEVALSAHLVVGPSDDTDGLLKQARDVLHERFEIRHTTLQLELDGQSLGCAPCIGT